MDGLDYPSDLRMGMDAVSMDVVVTPLLRAQHDYHEDRAFEILDRAICGHVRQEECDMTMRQVAVLMTIAKSPGNVCDIARRLNMSFASVSRAVDTLTRLSLASRKRQDDDRRVVEVSLTPKGHSMVGRLMAETMGDPIAA